jgi:hypothetical protein
MGWRRCVVGLALLAWAAQGPAVGAEGWVSPTAVCEVKTAFGAACPSGTHRGIDLAAVSGDEISTPAGGSVVFAGRVPADGGGTCGAVTVRLANGLLVSLLPLDEVFVSADDAVAPGEVLGTLAHGGDDSMPGSHLHLGLRQGDIYLDPAELLPALAGAPVPPAPVAEPTLPGDPEPPARTGSSASAGAPAVEITAETQPVRTEASCGSAPTTTESLMAIRAPLRDAGISPASSISADAFVRKANARQHAITLDGSRPAGVLALAAATAALGLAANRRRLAAVRSWR